MDSEVVDRAPMPSLTPGRALSGTYVDNICMIGVSAKVVCERMAEIQADFDLDGVPLEWFATAPVKLLESLGVLLDLEGGTMRHKPRRVWKTVMAGRVMLRRRRLHPRVLLIWLGHAVDLLRLARPGLSAFDAFYRWIEKADDRRTIVWDSVRRELRVAIGLFHLAEVNLKAPCHDEIGCGDSSMRGYAFHVARATAPQVWSEWRWHERWRHLRVPHGRPSQPVSLVDVLDAGGLFPGFVDDEVDKLTSEQEQAMGDLRVRAGRPSAVGSKAGGWRREARGLSAGRRGPPSGVGATRLSGCRMYDAFLPSLKCGRSGAASSRSWRPPGAGLWSTFTSRRPG